MWMLCEGFPSILIFSPNQMSNETFIWLHQLFYYCSPTFVLENEKLLKDRFLSTCGLINGKDGQPVVAIVGGAGPSQKGMEIWNPRTKTVELLWEEIPPEVGGEYGLRESELVVIKGGTEFFLYGVWNGNYQDGIWKYVVAENSWTRQFSYSIIYSLLLLSQALYFRIGDLLTSRYGHVTLPVSGIECP